MSAQDAVDNIAAKEGVTDKSFTPLFHSEQLQMVVDEFSTLSFYSESVVDTGTISDDSNDPTFITGLTMKSGTSDGFRVVLTDGVDTGTVLNDTGYDLDMIGMFDMYVNNQGGASRIDMWSETSTDGITWATNDLSARSMEVSNNTESSITKESKTFNWVNGTMLRFAVTDSGGGSATISKPTIEARGVDLQSHSFSWRLTSVARTEA